MAKGKIALGAGFIGYLIGRKTKRNENGKHGKRSKK